MYCNSIKMLKAANVLRNNGGLMRFSFYTLGCKVNMFETQALSQLAEERGHIIVEKDADAVIINTCTVTSVSDHKNIRAFHKLRKDNPKAVIAACGCFAEAEPDRIRQMGEVDLVCGTRDRARVISLCENAVLGQPVTGQQDGNGTGFELLPAGVPHGRTRALLKIEDGCDNYCAYCIIPYVRGHVRSLSSETVEKETARLESKGAHEIVLTGIEIASYGRDLNPKTSLVSLLCGLLEAHPGVRFRLGSLDPRIVNEEFCLRLARFGNLARHFHLSLQSGCDAVLERMGRRYTTEDVYGSVQRLGRSFPDCSVTADLIVGFPGETEEEFASTMRFMERCGFASVHVFPFSVRKGTRAAGMEGQLTHEVKACRALRAKETASALSERHRRGFVGRVMDALPEHRTEGMWVAHGAYGFPIYIIDGQGIMKNCPVMVQAVRLYKDGVQAEIFGGV